jgi:hypothetical protein
MAMKKFVLAFYPEDQESGREIVQILRRQKLYRTSALWHSQAGNLKSYEGGPPVWQWILLCTFVIALIGLLCHLSVETWVSLSDGGVDSTNEPAFGTPAMS